MFLWVCGYGLEYRGFWMVQGSRAFRDLRGGFEHLAPSGVSAGLGVLGVAWGSFVG